jgi:hypothetical protein
MRARNQRSEEDIMWDVLLTLSLLLSLAGLSRALWTLVGSHGRATCARREPGDASNGLEAYGQDLVATYLVYRQ